MIVKLVEVCQAMSVGTAGAYTLREVFVNPEHVVCLRSDDLTRQRLQENKLPPELDERQEFTRIQLNRGNNGLDLIVVGAPSVVEKKLKMSRHLIRG
mgnify:FL=1|jgi:hypothetical protein|tara:strand:- start:467 stop:757 length:291 start_codon:yes stop_codon:yes gene_type:complete